jgi:hypothetical protein
MTRRYRGAHRYKGLLDMRGRPQSAQRQTWDQTITSKGLPDVPDGIDVDITPAPGRTYTQYTWPPRGRGRGESLTSPRRIAAKLRTIEVIRMRAQFYTWNQIARTLGFKDASGPYRAYKRAVDRVDWNTQRKAVQRRERSA